MGKERNMYADFVKGLLIIMVVTGHTIQGFKYEVGSNLFWIDLLFKYIYVFHMPLFFAVSGYYTALSIGKLSAFNFIKKRIIYLLVPLIAWVIVLLVIDFLSTSNNYNISSFFLYCYRMLISSYWFVWGILIYSITMGLIRFFKLDNKYFVCAIGIASMLIPSPFSNVTLAFAKDMFCFFIIGYLLINVDLYKLYLISKKYIIGLFFLSMLCLYIFPTNAFIYFSPSDIYHIDTMLIRFITAISTSIVFLTITYFIYIHSAKGVVIDYICRFGTETLGIYLIQGAVFYICQLNIETRGYNSSLYSVFYIIPSIFMVYFIYVFIKLINKNKVLAFIFLGKQMNTHHKKIN